MRMPQNHQTLNDFVVVIFCGSYIELNALLFLWSFEEGELRCKC